MQSQKTDFLFWNKTKAQGEEKMSKPSKEFEYRMQGMIYALNIAKKDGVYGIYEPRMCKEMSVLLCSEEGRRI